MSSTQLVPGTPFPVSEKWTALPSARRRIEAMGMSVEDVIKACVGKGHGVTKEGNSVVYAGFSDVVLTTSGSPTVLAVFVPSIETKGGRLSITRNASTQLASLGYTLEDIAGDIEIMERHRLRKPSLTRFVMQSGDTFILSQENGSPFLLIIGVYPKAGDDTPWGFTDSARPFARRLGITPADLSEVLDGKDFDVSEGCSRAEVKGHTVVFDPFEKRVIFIGP